MDALSPPPNRRITVAEARADLSAVVHDAREHGPVELTEDGEPVAVLIGRDLYGQLTEERPDTWTAYQRFLASIDPADLPDDDVFADVRDRSPGRDVEL